VELDLHKNYPMHYIIHKPFGYLSQFTGEGPKKKRLGELFDFPEGIMAIGRLDEDSEGLLLLTTEGRMSEEVRSKKVEKEYFAQVDGIITEEAVQKLTAGIEIGLPRTKYFTQPCKAFILNSTPEFSERSKKVRDDRHGPTSWASITLTEGKNRQVRKMCAAVGFPVLRLIRVRVGNIHLKDLKPGEVRQVDAFHI